MSKDLNLEIKENFLDYSHEVNAARAFPNVTDLTQLTEGSEYPIILLAKIELYLKLAVLKADRVDIGADNNNYLKKIS